MAENTILVEKRDDAIAFVILNKPDRLNAIDTDMMDMFVAALHDLENDDSIKVIIIKGQGDHFCSGGDLKRDLDVPILPGIEEDRKAIRKYGRAAFTLQQIEKPVIAMVKGFAVGGGMSLALACDLIFAAEDAKFGSVFLKVGITPEMGALVTMPMTIGLYRAKELWFTGRTVDAQEAYGMGFVNRVLPKEKLEEATLAFAAELTKMPTAPMRITKRLANSTIFNMFSAVLEMEAELTPFCKLTDEFQQKIMAFRKK